MREDPATLQRLRRIFGAGSDEAQPGDDCPEPGAIWDAVHGELPPEATRRIVKHLRLCPSCAAEWRTAMEREEAAPAAVSQGGPTAPAGSRTLSRWWPLAVAALVVMGLSISIVVRRSGITPEAPALRADEGVLVESLIPEDRPLPRKRFLLRWAPVEEDARYSVKVDRPDLTPVASATDLEKPEYLVPPDALEGIPSGGTLVWRVEAQLLDGRRVRSAAFLVRVE